MGDETEPPQARGRGALPIRRDLCPMLTSTNYSVWVMRMKVLMRIYQVWETIEPGSTDLKKNDVARTLLFLSIPETLILQVGDQDTSKKVWDAIKSRHLGPCPVRETREASLVRESRLHTLMAEFDRLKMSDTDSVDDYARKISSLSSKSAALGEIIEEPKLVKKFFKGLPRSKYIHIVVSLEQILDLNTTGFEDIVERLKAYEERVKEETQEKLMYATNDKPNRGGFGGYHGRVGGGYGGVGGGYGGFRGRARGGWGRGRGRGRFNNQYQWREAAENNDKPKKNLSKIQCWRCDKLGHFASTCPTRPTKNQEAN